MFVSSRADAGVSSVSREFPLGVFQLGLQAPEVVESNVRDLLLQQSLPRDLPRVSVFVEQLDFLRRVVASDSLNLSLPLRHRWGCFRSVGCAVNDGVGV